MAEPAAATLATVALPDGSVAHSYDFLCLALNSTTRIQLVAVAYIESRLLVGVPQSVWHRRIASKRVLPALTKPSLVEVGCMEEQDRSVEIADQTVKLWMGFLNAELADLIVKVDDETQFTHSTRFRRLLPLRTWLGCRRCRALCFPIGDGRRGATINSSARRIWISSVGISDGSIGAFGRVVGFEVGQCNWCHAGASATTSSASAICPQTKTSGEGGPTCEFSGIGSERGSSSVGSRCGSEESGRDATAHDGTSDKRETFKGASGFESESQCCFLENRSGQCVVGDGQRDRTRRFKPRRIWRGNTWWDFAFCQRGCCTASPNRSSSKVECALDGISASGVNEAGSIGSGKKTAAARRALRLALAENPEEIVSLIERLMMEDLSSQTVTPGQPLPTLCAKAWVEHRSRIGHSKSSSYTAWTVAAALDSLRAGNIQGCRARLNLMLLMLDQTACDRGSWTLSSELSLEQPPPMSVLQTHAPPSVQDGEMPFSRLLDPRWAEVAMAHVRDTEEYLVRRNKLGRKDGHPEAEPTPKPKPKPKGKAAASSSAAVAEAWTQIFRQVLFLSCQPCFEMWSLKTRLVSRPVLELAARFSSWQLDSLTKKPGWQLSFC